MEEGLSAPLCPVYRVPLLCSSPGPARDMQPTMKFVMDTSKYWFKPSITREQGKGKQCFRGQGLGISSGPWVGAEEGMASGRSREGQCPADLMTWGNRDCSSHGRG